MRALAALPAHGAEDLPQFWRRFHELRTSGELVLPIRPGAYQAYTDGACQGNPDGPGGWAAVVSATDGEGGDAWELWGHLSSTSNNRAEALGLLAALEWTPSGSSLTVYADSELTLKIVSGAYKAKANRDIWDEIRTSIAERRITVKGEWVPGHAGVPGNEQADALSVLGAVNGNVERWERQRAKATVRTPARSAAPKGPVVTPAALEGASPRGPWEEKFFASVLKQVTAGKVLSEKQQAIVDRMKGRS